MEKELRLSVSKTKCFEQCKKQYRFSYILKFPKKEYEYHTFGKFCHKVLEDFHLVYITDKSIKPFHIEMATAFKDALNSEEFKGKMTASMKKEAKQIIDQYLKLITTDKNNNCSANVLNAEEKFELAISDHVVLNGIIDRIQLDSDGILHVADYKTTKDKKYLKNDWFQLATYAHILKSKHPEITKVRGSYVLLRHDFEYITKEFSLDEIAQIKDQYLKIAEEIESETVFEANPSRLCKGCSFLEHCVEGSQIMKPKTTFGEVSW